jgi:translation initiation factor eIF-2B subunit delta
MAEHAMKKLTRGDIILTYGYSEAVAVILTKAHQEHGLTDLTVWVCDAGPQFTGKEMLKTLQEAGVRCGYVLLHSISYILPHVTKVFLGASALFSNGSIYAPSGTACVALLATQDSSNNIPTLVCCETYKISNKVQLESITHNELGDPDALAGMEVQDGVENLKRLNLLYDVTPSEYVSGIVTELGIIPPTSVAVLLREMNPQDAAYRP